MHGWIKGFTLSVLVFCLFFAFHLTSSFPTPSLKASNPDNLGRALNVGITLIL